MSYGHPATINIVAKTSNIAFAILQGRHSGRSPESPYFPGEFGPLTSVNYKGTPL